MHVRGCALYSTPTVYIYVYNTYICIHVCMYVCMDACMHVMYTHTRKCVDTYVHICICTYMHICICTYVHIYICCKHIVWICEETQHMCVSTILGCISLSCSQAIARLMVANIHYTQPCGCKQEPLATCLARLMLWQEGLYAGGDGLPGGPEELMGTGFVISQLNKAWTPGYWFCTSWVKDGCISGAGAAARHRRLRRRGSL